MKIASSGSSESLILRELIRADFLPWLASSKSCTCLVHWASQLHLLSALFTNANPGPHGREVPMEWLYLHREQSFRTWTRTLTLLNFWSVFLFSSIVCFNWIHLNFERERKCVVNFSTIRTTKLFYKLPSQSLSRQGHHAQFLGAGSSHANAVGGPSSGDPSLWDTPTWQSRLTDLQQLWVSASWL